MLNARALPQGGSLGAAGNPVDQFAHPGLAQQVFCPEFGSIFQITQPGSRGIGAPAHELVGLAEALDGKSALPQEAEHVVGIFIDRRVPPGVELENEDAIGLR